MTPRRARCFVRVAGVVITSLVFKRPFERQSTVPYEHRNHGDVGADRNVAHKPCRVLIDGRGPPITLKCRGFQRLVLSI
jgi:hypothetical protein